MSSLIIVVGRARLLLPCILPTAPHGHPAMLGQGGADAV